MSEEGLGLDDINIKVADLLNSKHPEHHALAEKYRDLLQVMIDEGRPILRLMTIPHKLLLCVGVREWVTMDCLELGIYKVYPDVFLRLLLTDEGTLLEITQFVSQNKTLEVRGKSARVGLTKGGTSDSRHLWEQIPFGEIIDNLSKALSEARNRNVCLQEDVEEKWQILERALAVLKGGQGHDNRLGF